MVEVVKLLVALAGSAVVLTCSAVGFVVIWRILERWIGD